MPASPDRLLILLRHARAENDGATDHARPLSPAGLAQARRMGESWPEWLPWPDRVLCSDAARTRDTLHALVAGAGRPMVDVLLNRALYHADPEAMLEVVRANAAPAPCLLVVGHNPGAHALALRLANLEASALIHQLAQEYAPCTAAVFRLKEGAAWESPQAEEARLIAAHSTACGWQRA